MRIASMAIIIFSAYSISAFATDSTQMSPLKGLVPEVYQTTVEYDSTNCQWMYTRLVQISASDYDNYYDQDNTPNCPKGYVGMRGGILLKMIDTTPGSLGNFAIRTMAAQAYLYCCPLQYEWNPG